jgi:hypothetical protein
VFAAKRWRLQHTFVPDLGLSGNILGNCSHNSYVQHFPSPPQEGAMGTVGYLGPPRGMAIDDEDGATAGVPGWLTRLFNPPDLSS